MPEKNNLHTRTWCRSHYRVYLCPPILCVFVVFVCGVCVVCVCVFWYGVCVNFEWCVCVCVRVHIWCVCGVCVCVHN